MPPVPTASTSSAIGCAALDYVARGWSVIPIAPRGERPLVDWHEFRQHAAGAEQVRLWFVHRPEANVGLVTGGVSGFVVVDVDVQHDGPASLGTLQARHGPLPPTVESTSGGGRRHLYYRHPGVTVANRVAIHPGIDLRGDGACIVAPPSVDASGRPCAWVPGHAPDELALAPVPRHFFGASPETLPVARSRNCWRPIAGESGNEGLRHSGIASLCANLLARDVDAEVVLELMLIWNRTHCRPPLADDEVAAVVHRIARGPAQALRSPACRQGLRSSVP